MITNKKQLSITSDQRNRLALALSELEGAASIKPNINVTFIDVQKRALRSKIKDFDDQIARYTQLSSGQISNIKVERLSDIGVALIEARIAARLTQKQLASLTGIAEQQIQRYEATKYSGASLERLQKIADSLQSVPELTLTVPKLSGDSAATKIDRFPFNEMEKRGWIQSRRAPIELVASAYVAERIPNGFGHALNRMRVRQGGIYDAYSMLAWKARILDLAKRIEPTLGGSDPYQGIDFERLVKLSGQEDGISQAVELVRSSGIALVFEPHLPKTHLDGAAMLSPWGRPVIGLTLRHDREDNFWFTLLHEIAHVYLHRESGLQEGFFDDQSAESEEKYEREADEFALNAMIPKEVWESSLVRFTNKEESVKNFATKLGISVAIVAGRIRNERKAWKKFHKLVGAGVVQNQLRAAGYLEA